MFFGYSYCWFLANIYVILFSFIWIVYSISWCLCKKRMSRIVFFFPLFLELWFKLLLVYGKFLIKQKMIFTRMWLNRKQVENCNCNCNVKTSIILQNQLYAVMKGCWLPCFGGSITCYIQWFHFQIFFPCSQNRLGSLPLIKILNRNDKMVTNL